MSFQIFTKFMSNLIVNYITILILTFAWPWNLTLGSNEGSKLGKSLFSLFQCFNKVFDSNGLFSIANTFIFTLLYIHLSIEIQKNWFCFHSNETYHLSNRYLKKNLYWLISNVFAKFLQRIAWFLPQKNTIKQIRHMLILIVKVLWP